MGFINTSFIIKYKINKLEKNKEKFFILKEKILFRKTSIIILRTKK